MAQIHEQKVTSVVTARSGSQAVDSRTGGRTVVLNQGYRYVGEPGSAQFDVIQFNTLTTHFKLPQFMYSSSKRKIEPTGRLPGTGDPHDRDELQWRVGAPIAAIGRASIRA